MTAPVPAPAPAGWTVLAPIKRLDGAKTRLSTRPAGLRRDLALAFAIDTVDAALTVPEVVRVLAVTDDDVVREAMDALGAGWIPDVPELGLNGGITDAAARVRREEPGVALAVLVADLPALRGEELSRALRAAAAVPRGFVADAAGTGTTLLTPPRAPSPSSLGRSPGCAATSTPRSTSGTPGASASGGPPPTPWTAPRERARPRDGARPGARRLGGPAARRRHAGPRVVGCRDGRRLPAAALRAAGGAAPRRRRRRRGRHAARPDPLTRGGAPGPRGPGAPPE